MKDEVREAVEMARRVVHDNASREYSGAKMILTLITALEEAEAQCDHQLKSIDNLMLANQQLEAKIERMKKAGDELLTKCMAVCERVADGDSFNQIKSAAVDMAFSMAQFRDEASQ